MEAGPWKNTIFHGVNDPDSAFHILGEHGVGSNHLTTQGPFPYAWWREQA